MTITIGSARVDERGTYSGGAAGDQTGKEVSMQEFYVHKKGWIVIRPKDSKHAEKIAQKMITACNNPNLGYDQGQRTGVITYGVASKTKTECDCSALVRACVKEATGIDPGNFTTANEVEILTRTSLFEKAMPYTNGMKIYTGDILVTKTKGHTVICTKGYDRTVTTQQREGMPEIQFGSQGKAVKIWQIIVDITADGLFGGKTQERTKEWQKNHGLVADGIVGPKTWAAAMREL